MSNMATCTASCLAFSYVASAQLVHALLNLFHFSANLRIMNFQSMWWWQNHSYSYNIYGRTKGIQKKRGHACNSTGPRKVGLRTLKMTRKESLENSGLAQGNSRIQTWAWNSTKNSIHESRATGLQEYLCKECDQPAFRAGEVEEVSTSRPKRKRDKKPLHVNLILDVRATVVSLQNLDCAYDAHDVLSEIFKKQLDASQSALRPPHSSIYFYDKTGSIT